MGRTTEEGETHGGPSRVKRRGMGSRVSRVYDTIDVDALSIMNKMND